MPAPLTLAARRPATRRGGVLAILSHWAQLRRERQALARLDDHLLRDLGLTRHDAAEEAARPVWDAPRGWMR